MHPRRLSILLFVGVVVAITVGTGLILRAGTVLAGVGVALVIAGLVGLMPALRYQLAVDAPAGDEWRAD